MFERKDALKAEQMHLFLRLKNFAMAFALMEPSTASSGNSDLNFGVMRRTFCGWHADLLSSLVLATCAQLEHQKESAEDVGLSEQEKADRQQERLFRECVQRLLWVATPEATCKLMSFDKGNKLKSIMRETGTDCSDVYFKQQRHSSLAAFAGQLGAMSDDLGVQAVVMTYSPLSQDAVRSFNSLEKERETPAPARSAGVSESKGEPDPEEEGEAEESNKPITLTVTHIVLHEIDQGKHV